MVALLLQKLVLALVLWAVIVCSAQFEDTIDKEWNDTEKISIEVPRVTRAMTTKGAKGWLGAGQVPQLVADGVGLLWPAEETYCQTPLCGGHVNLHTVLTYPEVACWFCKRQFYNWAAITSLRRQQNELIGACGGLDNPDFARSRLAKQTFGYPVQQPEVQKGKDKDKGKGKNKSHTFPVKGKFDKNDKGKGRDKDKGKQQAGKDMDNEGEKGAVGKPTLLATVLDRLTERSTDTGAEAHASRGSSVASRKKEPQTQQQQITTEVDFGALMNTCSSLDELKAKMLSMQGKLVAGDSGKEKSVPEQNHEVAAAVAQALRKTEELKGELNNKKQEILQLEKDFEAHVQMVREEYRSLRDSLDAEQDRMLASLRQQKAEIKDRLEQAKV